MFVCLSSGASPRYRQDVLRALAMPKGTRLQFRYDLRWVAPAIRDRLSAGSGNGTQCLIAYIDQQDKTKIPELVPCRLAKLSDAQTLGTTVSLGLVLDDLAYAEDLGAFNNEVKTASAGTLPAWQPDGKIKGSYWLDAGQELRTVVRSSNLAEWEKIVGQIVAHSDFANESVFYTVEGVYLVGFKARVSSQEGAYELAAGQEYDICIYHFSPTQAPGGSRLRLDMSGRGLTFTSNAELILDSRYDLKRVRIRTERPSTRETAILAISRKDTPQGEWTLDFDLCVEIRGAFWKTLGYGVVLGILLAVPQIVAAFSNPSLPRNNAIAISVASGVLGLITGILAAFGLKKSV